MIRSLRCLWLLLIAAMLLAPGIGNAVDLLGLGVKHEATSKSEQKTDPKQLKSSLDDIIHTLKDDQKRSALLKQLQQLRNSIAAESSQGSSSETHKTGLLGALSSSLGDLSKQAETNGSPLPLWRRHLHRAMANLHTLYTQTPRAELIRNVLETIFGFGLWLAAVLGLAFAERQWFGRRDWPLVLPLEPGPWILTAHFTRRIIPVLITFLGLLACVRLLGITAPAGIALLIIAYVALCGRLLSTVFDVVISLFTRGHRRVAVAILHNVALKWLFVIGALVAFGDAVNSDQIAQLLGRELAKDIEIFSNALAGLLSGILILRIRRPAAHLIGNRTLRHRRRRGSFQELASTLARLWHIPALLLVSASMVAMFVTGGHAHAALARSVICAVLLVLALVISGLLRRQHERRNRKRRPHQGDHIVRLRKLGFTLAHVLTWAIFAELSVRVWGLSLFALGAQGAGNGGLGEELIDFGLTILVAWLAWIVIDTAIHRALHGRHHNTNRAQTITPMIRNIALFTIIVIAAISGLASLGVDITPLLAGAGVIGIALGFGAQNLVADLITGIFILIEDSLAVGDFVEINGYMGTVEGLNMRNVRLRDLDGIVHITTFSRIQAIHNMSREFGIALMKLRIPNDLPIDTAIELMQQTAADLQRDPFIRGLIRSHLEMQGIHEFDNGCPILRMRLRTTPEYQWDVARAFNLALKRRMESEYINLGAPRLSVSMESGGGARFDKNDKSSQDSATTMDWPIDEEPAPDAS